MANKMSYDDFANAVYEIIKEKKKEHTVRLQYVPKNNGVILRGIAIIEGENGISPTVYLEGFYNEEYLKGAELEETVESILACYERGKVSEKLDMSFFREFDKVKDRICYRLVNTKTNEEYLKNVPHLEFLDLSICFYYDFESKAIGSGIINISNIHTEMWGVDANTLYELAKENTLRLRIAELMPMDNILSDNCPLEEEMLAEYPMYVLSNSKRAQGAAAILDKDLLVGCADILGGSFWIIPSSIHEVILVKDEGDEGVDEMFRQMIMEWNRTLLAEEILSEHPYYYNSEKGVVEQLFLMN